MSCLRSREKIEKSLEARDVSDDERGIYKNKFILDVTVRLLEPGQLEYSWPIKNFLENKG